jgi:hypothetical protein
VGDLGGDWKELPRGEAENSDVIEGSTKKLEIPRKEFFTR